MNTSVNSLKLWAGKNTSVLQGMSAPLLVVAILALMVLPIPAWLLDTFFTLNIAVALMVMMVAAYMIRPLDFAAFPSVLLLTTLMRLSLNVASTRVVLLEGHTGPGAAGAVIEAFGHFLIGGNFAVGLIVFAILVVINFIVVTKGAERIAEVSARFTLDAMPGKQMAVDADLNAGLIDEKEAKRRRAEVGEEANFFGSMDGASKFVRGDAVAGILILLINIVGGFTIGVLQHGLTAKEAADSYILLAIGDALVAQIPGLLISVAAAMVVSRVGKEHDMGRQIVQQLFMSPRVLGVTAGILIMLGLIPGMPHIVFLVIGTAFGYGAWTLYQRQQAPVEPEAPPAPPHDRWRSHLGRPAAHRPAGPGTGLPFDLAGGQEPPGRPAHPHQGRAPQVCPGSGFPAPCRACARQPGTQAQRLPHHPARRGGGRRRGLPRHVPGHQSRRHHHTPHRHPHHRPCIRPASTLD